MFISILDLFKIGIGPSSSHTMGPMTAAFDFQRQINAYLATNETRRELLVRCTLKGSLAYTGKGHATDHAIALGLQGFLPGDLANQDVDALIERVWHGISLEFDEETVAFSPMHDILFDLGTPLPEHPNGMIFELIDQKEEIILSETYFSIGGGGMFFS
jgi:L-serine dehydratase